MLTSVLISSLACYAVLVVWFDGSLFSELRAFVKARLDAWAEEKVAKPETVIQAETDTDNRDGGVVVSNQLPAHIMLFHRIAPRWLYHAMVCPLCLSVHVAYVLSALSWLLPNLATATTFSQGVVATLQWPVYSLAVVFVVTFLWRNIREESHLTISN